MNFAPYGGRGYGEEEIINAYFNQSQARRENTVEQEASSWGPKTFQEWPSFKEEYGRYTGVLFGLKVTEKA